MLDAMSWQHCFSAQYLCPSVDLQDSWYALVEVFVLVSFGCTHYSPDSHTCYLYRVSHNRRAIVQTWVKVLSEEESSFKRVSENATFPSVILFVFGFLLNNFITAYLEGRRKHMVWRHTLADWFRALFLLSLALVCTMRAHSSYDAVARVYKRGRRS